MPEQRIVFVDIESIGLDPRGPIRQIAAVAIDDRLQEVDLFDMKLNVDWRRIRQWQRDGRRRPPRPRPADEFMPAQAFADFLTRHATTQVLLPGGVLRVAQLAAHHAAHDGAFLQAFFLRNHTSYPGRYQMFCTMQRAMWLIHEQRPLASPSDFKLATLCRYFGVPFDSADAHDALIDIRATVALYRAMTTVCQDVSCRANDRHSRQSDELTVHRPQGVMV